MKEDQNTLPSEIDILKNPNTETILFRYILATSFCKEKYVLDASCGFGHGMGILKSLGANEVTGFDIDKKALKYSSKFGPVENVNLIKKNIDHENEFDSVISIETFEHLPKEKLGIYLSNLKHWCKNEGTIFITTPRRKPIEWHNKGGTHLYEYSVEEFVQILSNKFSGSTISFIGIQEIRIGEFAQLISILNADIFRSDILCAIIKLKK